MYYYVSGTVAHVEPYLAVIDCGGDPLGDLLPHPLGGGEGFFVPGNDAHGQIEHGEGIGP